MALQAVIQRFDLSTISHLISGKNADNSIHLSGETLIGFATFSEVAKKIPDFARTAELAGLIAEVEAHKMLNRIVSR